jgi:hypothetical protein
MGIPIDWRFDACAACSFRQSIVTEVSMMALMSISGQQAHALDGGIPSLFHFGHHWPAASDVVRYATR